MLTEKSYLVVENADLGEGVFELRRTNDESTELERQMLLGQRGGLIQSLSDLTPGVQRLGKDGAAYNVDAGDGNDTMTITFGVQQEDVDEYWGNGTGRTSADDASGGHPIEKRDALRYWLRTTKTDSGTPALLHHGNWCTERFADEAGFFGEPMEVVVLSLSTEWKDEEPSEVTGTLTLRRTSSYPDFPPDVVGDVLDDLTGEGGSS